MVLTDYISTNSLQLNIRRMQNHNMPEGAEGANTETIYGGTTDAWQEFLYQKFTKASERHKALEQELRECEEEITYAQTKQRLSKREEDRVMRELDLARAKLREDTSALAAVGDKRKRIDAEIKKCEEEKKYTNTEGVHEIIDKFAKPIAAFQCNTGELHVDENLALYEVQQVRIERFNHILGEYEWDGTQQLFVLKQHHPKLPQMTVGELQSNPSSCVYCPRPGSPSYAPDTPSYSPNRE